MDDRAGSHAFASFRARFPGAQRQIYMDVAARGLLSTRVRDAIDAYLEHRMLQGADKPWMFDEVERTRSSIGRLINADADEIAFTKNVSDGINEFASALPWQRNDNVVICEALEHPANIYPWYNVRKLAGVEIKVVPPREGIVPLERVMEAVDARTRLVAISTVSFSPGARFPVEELGVFCRSRGILLAVDAAQSVGILKTDVRSMQVDALAASTQKGLLALYGAGFLYVRKTLADTLWPRYLSRQAIVAESGHEAATGDLSDLRIAPAARRFDVGNYNYLAAIALKQSLEDLCELGADAIEIEVRALARRLAMGLRELGLPLYGHYDESHSHIVSVGSTLSGQHDATDDARLMRLHSHLARHGARLTIRRGLLRFSLHAYNNIADVDRVLELVSEWKVRSGF